MSKRDFVKKKRGKAERKACVSAPRQRDIFSGLKNKNQYDRTIPSDTGSPGKEVRTRGKYKLYQELLANSMFKEGPRHSQDKEHKG